MQTGSGTCAKSRIPATLWHPPRERRRRMGIGLLSCIGIVREPPMYRQTILAFLTGFLGVSLLAGQERLAKLPTSPAEAGSSCNRAGRVVSRNVFAQTFLLKLDDDQIETVAFSRWTEFLNISPASKSPHSREIEPTEIRPGDRLCVLLDPSEATARFILVLEPVRALAKTAAAGPL